MRSLAAVLALVLGAAAAAGQSPGRGSQAGRGGRRVVAGIAPDKGLLQDLYDQAKRAVNGVPPVAAPVLLLDIARDEMRDFPATGLEDFAEAFDLARALAPANSADDTAGQMRMEFKRETELNAVSELARRGHTEQALAMLHAADIPRAPLYDQLVLLADMNAAELDDPRPSSEPKPVAKPAAGDAAAGREAVMDAVWKLVQECQRSDNTFPYRGVAGVLRRPGNQSLSRLDLVRDGYRWAANEQDPERMADAFTFLQVAHRAEPELDQELETALMSLLGRQAAQVEQPGVSATLGTGARLSGRLEALLQQVDPERAAQYAAENALPDIPATPPQVTVISGAGGGPLTFRLNPGTITFSTTVAAPAHESREDQIGSGQFRQLVAQAEGLRRRDPGTALAAANQAAGMLDDTLWASETTEAVRLATLYDQLGAHADAARLLARALDEAESQGRQADTRYPDADPETQARLVRGTDASESTALEVYSLAARLDLPYTAARAETAQFLLLKPLVLARIALVAEVGGRFVVVN